MKNVVSNFRAESEKRQATSFARSIAKDKKKYGKRLERNLKKFSKNGLRMSKFRCHSTKFYAVRELFYNDPRTEGLSLEFYDGFAIIKF